MGHRAAIAHQLEASAFIAVAQGRLQRAAHLLGAAETLREKISIRMSPSERVEYETEVENLRAALDEEEFRSRWAEGQALAMDQAISYALEEPQDRATA